MEYFRTSAPATVEYIGALSEGQQRKGNGAQSGKEYGYGGCALAYNEDICKRLCTGS